MASALFSKKTLTSWLAQAPLQKDLEEAGARTEELERDFRGDRGQLRRPLLEIGLQQLLGKLRLGGKFSRSYCPARPITTTLPWACYIFMCHTASCKQPRTGPESREPRATAHNPVVILECSGCAGAGVQTWRNAYRAYLLSLQPICLYTDAYLCTLTILMHTDTHKHTRERTVNGKRDSDRWPRMNL